MKFFLISDNVDTLTGMRLAGIPGVVAHTAEETSAAVNGVLADTSIGILIVTQNLKKLYPDIFTEITLGKSLPLVVEVPDRHGFDRNRNSIAEYIESAIGLKL